MPDENKDSFFLRLKPHLSPSSLLDVKLAYMLAKFGHRAQVRKEEGRDGRPLRYFEHVRRVAIILIDEIKIVDPTMVIASLIHDGFEDTQDLTPELIEHCFCSDVTTIVKLLSKVPKEGYVERLMQCNDWRVLTLKLCDRVDNLRSLFATSAEFRKKQLAETEEKYVPLGARLIDITPKINLPNAYRAQELLTTALEVQKKLFHEVFTNTTSP